MRTRVGGRSLTSLGTIRSHQIMQLNLKLTPDKFRKVAATFVSAHSSGADYKMMMRGLETLCRIAHPALCAQDMLVNAWGASDEVVGQRGRN